MTRWGFSRKAGRKVRPDALIRPIAWPIAVARPAAAGAAPTSPPMPWPVGGPALDRPARPARRKRGSGRGIVYGGPLKRMAKAQGLRASVVLAPDHPAIVERRPLFPGTVVGAGDSPRLLVSGENQRKLGAKVMKGRWKGMPIYALTLPERETCPKSCQQWLTCYGNNMPFARRHRLDDAMMDRLRIELDLLAKRHPSGFVVRVHVLGDFGAPENEPLALCYVDLWTRALRDTPQLRVFGFTAHDPDEEIGSAILGMNLEFPDRCRIRFSGTVDDEGFGSIVIPSRADSKHILCPVQTDKTDCCGTCGLCWTTPRTIEFERHP